MEFQTPRALVVEHEELHAELETALPAGGPVGAAAQKVADALHKHFEAEDRYALPPLGLLRPLAEGRLDPEMVGVLSLTDRLKADLPQMLAEHREITAALEELSAAARQAGQERYAQFAEKLRLHAQLEEEVSYPAALLVGEYLKLKLNR
jgi:hypothetical protein